MTVDDDEPRIGTNGHVNDGRSDTTSENEEEEDEEEDDAERRVAAMSSRALGPAPTNIHMENTSEVQVGPRLLYNAPVTVNQTVHLGSGNGDVLQYALKAPLQDLDLNTNNIQGEYSLKTPTTKDAPKVGFCNWKWLMITAGFMAFLVIAVGLIVFFLSPRDKPITSENVTLFPEVPTDEPLDPNMTLPGHHQIYSKDDWSGVPAKYKRHLKHPTPFVVISQTSTPSCYIFSPCAQLLRMIQDDAMSSQSPDIDDNFYVGGEGNAYEARGWDVTNVHESFTRRCNIGISFIGNFHRDFPNDWMINATKELINLGVKLGKISSDYKLVPSSAIDKSSASAPGRKLYEIIEKWPHFWIPNPNDSASCPYEVV